MEYAKMRQNCDEYLFYFVVAHREIQVTTEAWNRKFVLCTIFFSLL